MKLRTDRAGADKAIMPPSRFAFREPLLAVSIAIPLLLGCRGEGKAAQPAQASSADTEQVEIPHFIPSPSAYKTTPSQSPSPEAAVQSVPPIVASPTTAQTPLSDVYPALSGIINGRVAQASPKMKLTPEQGRLAESYLRADLPSMQSTALLASRMPKTAVELVRSVHERGVTREDAEGMAAYLNRMLDTTGMSRLDKFDECCSHVLGRRWGQIDYSGESLDPQRQERFYSSRGVPDLLTAENVRRYFAVESKMPYFRRIFNPQGPLPEF
ncbi:MAG: hypothetical protein V1861_03480 [Candidatus Micrarchaeota archaeon]